MEEEEKIFIYNPEAENTKTIPTDNEQKEVDTEEEGGFVYDPSAYDFSQRADNRTSVDLEDYRGYLGEDIYLPEGENGVAGLDKARAINQPWYEQAGSMLGQAVVGEIAGGTIEGLGYLLDVASYKNIAQGEEAEWGNWLSDIGKSMREGSQEAMPIYQVNEGDADFSDSGWWFSNGVSVASTLSLLIPSSAATKALSFVGKSMSKGAGMISKSLDVAAKMNKQQRWMSEGISQAIVSRHMENMMESSGTFDQLKEELTGTIDPETGDYFTDDKANSLASDAAASNYKTGWAMLLQDIPQYLAIGKVFNPRTMKMENALKKLELAERK